MQQKAKEKIAKKVSACIVLFLFTSLVAGQIAFGQDNTNTSEWSMNISILTEKNQTITPAIFAPFELIQLEAKVNYGNESRANNQVVFKIVGPQNSTSPNVIIRTAETDQNGTARITFRLPLGDITVNPVIGEWKVNCTTQTITGMLQEQTSFNVSKSVWPIIIQEVGLFDQNHTEKNSFEQGETAKVEVKINCTRASAVNASLRLDITDAGNTKTSQNTANQTLNDTQVIEYEFQIPDNAALGQALLNASLFSLIDEHEIQIAESKAVTFSIGEGSVQTGSRDIAVTSASLSATQIRQGEVLNVTIAVKNKGNTTEEPTIQILYNNILAGSLTVELSALEEKTVTYAWNTSKVSPGNFTVTVHANSVEGETETSDNNFTAGTIEILQQENAETATLFATSLFVVSLFIIGLTTFSSLSFLRWRQKPVSFKISLPLKREKQKKLLQPTPAIPVPPATSATVKSSNQEAPTARPVSYSNVLPITKQANAEIKSDIEKLQTDIGNNDILQNELTQLKLQSIELIPLSARAIELNIQKTQILRSNPSKQSQKELEALERLVNSQIEILEMEMANMKENIDALKKLTSGKDTTSFENKAE
ncbi:MAG: hypothetical protein ACQCN3_05310 [Candidatus Bathyarchaeia archaeon]